jgi:hypothetical protein
MLGPANALFVKDVSSGNDPANYFTLNSYMYLLMNITYDWEIFSLFMVGFVSAVKV